MSNKYERVYKTPKVQLIDTTIDDLSYLIWLKSRQWVINDIDGDKFMVNFDLSKATTDDLPEKFYVGSELVERDEYRNRILKMGLQYQNFDQYVFEVQGSCLFRDIVYNISKVSQWAMSNRFLFSILDENARFDSKNYYISSEYEGIEEWENQFDKYMDKIHEDPIVDHNRVEMPYSISSTFWFSINRKTLLDLLSFLKNKSSYFYEIYGKLILKETLINESDIPAAPSAAITQYIIKSDDWKDSVHNIDDTVIVNTEIGLILYSQFIRQADTTISGFYNILMHDDPKEFSHRVFKGNTPIKVHYVADRDKVNATVKTRLCAFAMSSGSSDDICSWSHFISNFIPKNITNEEFMKLLPCKFEDGKLTNCKFYDDVKFRNEGKEISNCPCPLVTLSMNNAKAKKERDNNSIGDAYYNLTEYLVNDGFDHSIKMRAWTSDFELKFDGNYIHEGIEGLTNDIQSLLDQVARNRTKTDGLVIQVPYQYFKYGIDGDLTCMLKGYSLDLISKLLTESGITKYVINFGGDMLVKGCKATVQVENTNFFVDIDATLHRHAIFTSGNTEKRGNHIVGGREHGFNVLIAKSLNEWDLTEMGIICDIVSTKTYANEKIDIDLIKFLDYDVLEFTEDGKLINNTYCASPFFNPDQIKLRDRMVSKFVNPFRPDLTESSVAFEAGSKDPDSVVQDNMDGICNADAIVFPSRTDDIGTLFEVGFALDIYHNKQPIIAYDEFADQYLIKYLTEYIDYKVEPNQCFLFDCSNKYDVISLGFMHSFINPDNIYYELKGSKDNLMVSTKFKHIELQEDGTYIEIERSKDSKDTDN